jgi:hypothetical protein
MLFDLRGAGRRRTVKFVYLGLALIMFVGFVGFSIGSSGISGGIIDAITQGGGGGSDSSTSRFQKQVQRAQAETRRNAEDPAAWAALAQARIRLAGVGGNFDSGSNNYTAGGKRELQAASTAWDRYLALNPKKPDDRLARQMLQAFVALNKPAEAVTAQEIVTDSNPTSATFQQLAVYAYQAGQTRKGDLAAGKAVQLAPKADRKNLKSQLDQFKLKALQAAAQASATPSGR